MAAAGWGAAATAAYVPVAAGAFTAALAGFRCCQLLLLLAEVLSSSFWLMLLAVEPCRGLLLQLAASWL